MKCEYGCGREAKYQFKNGKWCCENSQNKCPIIIHKNSEAQKGHVAWNKGQKLSEEHKQKLRGKRFSFTTSSSFKPGYISDNKHTTEYIRNYLAQFNYKLLSPEYKNALYQKLKVECPEGHQYKSSYATFQQGRRCPICRYINISGDNHPNWKGGISCEPYCPAWQNKEFKQDILERDNYQCQNGIFCWHLQCRYKFNIHHIDYNKKNCRPGNLITLCDSCNTRANFEREKWQSYYEAIMEKRGF